MHCGVAIRQVARRHVRLEVRVVLAVRREERVERVHVLLVAGPLSPVDDRVVREANREADQVLLDLRLRSVAQTCARVCVNVLMYVLYFMYCMCVGVCARAPECAPRRRAGGRTNKRKRQVS